MTDRNGSKKSKNILTLAWLIAAVLFVAAVTAAQAQMSMLHTSGTNIVNNGGQTVPLRGVNLGGWFIMEKWMAPLDSGSLPDTYSVIQELDNRFGVATEQSLMTAYQQAWITTTDLDNIKNAGFNVVRVPVWWGQFFPLNNTSPSGWRSDAFTELDWLVNNCAQRGIYVVIDMHGAVGGQSTNGDTGQQNSNQYWTNSADQTATVYMWQQIAAHYNGNATVAGYDLLNEPDNPPSNQAVWNAYSSLYTAIRNVDSQHMIFIEGTWGNWNWSMLPAPSQYGWTNVVYSMHEYQYNAPQSQVESGSSNQVSDFQNHSSWNVPGYVGEFNDFYNDSSVWGYTLNAFNNAGLSWSMWSYKAANALNPNSWGFYAPTYWPPTPNISSDSAATIQSDWQQWSTTNSFAKNTTIGISGGVNNGGGGSTPNPASGLTASTVSSNQINLAWSASSTSGVTYSVFRSTSSGFAATSGNQIASGLSGTSYGDSGLAASTTYYYLVEAVNTSGASSPTSQATATTAGNGGATTIAIDAGGPASGSYVADVDFSGGNTATTGATINTSAVASPAPQQVYQSERWGASTYTIPGLTAGSQYTVTLQFAEIYWTAAGQRQFNVNINGTQVLTNFDIFAAAGGENVAIAKSFTATASGTGQIVIQFTNGAADQAKISGIQVTTGGSTGGSAPAAPTNLTASAVSSSQINLSWTGSSTSGVTYSVFRGTSSGFAPSGSNQVASGSTSTSYSSTGLAPSTTYYFVVEAVNSNGASSSNQASATTNAATSGGISSTAFYQIVNQASGSCVDDAGGSTSNGATVQQWTCGTGNVNQQWLFTPTSNGYYEVTTHNSGTLAWNVVNVGTTPGTPMQLWTYGGGANEQFKPVLLPSGYYEFVDLNSGLCLNVPNGTTSNGVQLQVNTCNATTSESFKLNQQ